MNMTRTAKRTPGRSTATGFAHPPRNVAALGIKPRMNVADFGSGSGAYTLAIAEALSGSGRIYAVDIQRDLLRRTKNEAVQRGLKNVEVMWGDIEAPGGSKLSDAGLDLVLMSNTLFQLPDKRAALTEAARVLKPAGRLTVIDWSDSFGGLGPLSKDVMKKEAAISATEEAGFKLAEEFPAGAHHYGLIFEKA